MVAGSVFPVAQPGLQWELNERFEVEPTWTHDPKEQVIIELARVHLGFKDEDRCTADYYMQGAFNKIYLIRCPRDSTEEHSYIFRVSLPVDPGFKVSSDVATMKFVGSHTSIPVPRVIAFDASHHNKLGFAWTIMNIVRGRPLAEQWRYLNWNQKVNFVERIADANLDIFKHKFRKIGNLYKKTQAPPTGLFSSSPTCDGREILIRNGLPESPESTLSLDGSDDVVSMAGIDDLDEFHLGRIVSMPFIWHKRVQYRKFRGPFYSGHHWLQTRLDLVVMDCNAVLDESSTLDQTDSAYQHKRLAARLKIQLSRFYKDVDNEWYTRHKETVLHHYDTSGFNVMVDLHGNLSGLLDWDCVSAVPVWKACQLPEFLTSTFIDEFGDEGPPCETKMRTIAAEKAKLVNVFLDRVGSQDRLWVDVYKRCQPIRDFDLAVQLCDSRFKSEVVTEWVANVEQGTGYKGPGYWSLEKRLSGQ